MPDSTPVRMQHEEDRQKRWKTSGLAAAAVASLLLITGCATAASDEDASANSAGLDRFMDQELEFGACDPAVVESQPPVPQIMEAAERMECATLVVPMDYDSPNGETIDVAVARHAATGDDRIGSVVLNPGGPGFPSTSFAVSMAAVWADSAISERFDVVGFDPRGVGLTDPAVDCYTDAERDADAPIASLGTWTEESARAIVDKCSEGSGGEEALAHLGTRDVARDMDVLRSALGDDQLTFAGASYGSRLGAVYAEMFPQNVRALILDAAMDPQKNTRERRIQLTEGLQASFDRFAEFCATQPECPLGTDPARATPAVQQLLQPLAEQPLIAANGREVDFNAASEGIIAALYSEAGWPAIVAGLTELQDGQPDTLLALRDAYHGRLETGTYTNDFEATFAINCLDEERLTPDEAEDLIEQLHEAAPFLDPGSAQSTQDGCEFWPAEPTLGYPYATDIEGLPEVLVISATGDPVTPYDGGISLAETLGARLLTVEGNQHGTILSGNECVDGVVADYLVDLQLPEEGERCTL